MFANRVDAAEQLSNVLKGTFLPQRLLVLGIPRGGVVTASVIAQRLDVGLGAVIVKKIGTPHNPELAIGAYGEHDMLYWDKKLLEELQIEPETERSLAEAIAEEVRARQKLLSSWYKRESIKGKDILLVDDGIATGATAICAAKVVESYGAQSIFLVTPVIPEQVVQQVRAYVMEIITLQTPQQFGSVGSFYQSFPQVEDEEVKRLLQSNIHHSSHLQT